MATGINLQPAITTNASGLFSVTENGLIQGTAYDQPAIRYQLDGGIVDPSLTAPMYGGMGVYNNVPLSTAGSTTASETLGGYTGPATSITANAAKTLVGFSVFDQGYNGIITPQSPVPLYTPGQTINFYPTGSGARIAVQCLASLVSLDGGIITPQVSWDYVGQQLVPYAAPYAANTITGATWASTGGGQITYTVSTDQTAAISAGDLINVTGVVSTGATTNGYNGAWVVVSITSTTIVVTGPAATPGTYASGGTVVAGGGALPVRVLKVQIGGCKTVVYNAATGFATWNNNGNCAVIQI